MTCRIPVAVILAALVAGGCTVARETAPARTATEQLLISTAAEHAAAQLVLDVPPGSRVLVDSSNFEGVDGGYAVAAIRDHLLRRGLRLASLRTDADTVVEIRSGALSIDRNESLIGIPQFDIPVPLAAGSLTFPEIALYKVSQRRGVAKFAAVGYESDSGRHVGSTGAQYGFSHRTQWTVLFFIRWTRTDAIPREEDFSPYRIQPPELP